MVTHPLPPKTLVGEDYQIVGSLAGLADPMGLSVTYEGRSLSVPKRAMIRIFDGPSDAQNARDLKARFIQAARAAVRIDHPGAIPILDFGLMEDGTPYVIQALSPGHTVAAELVGTGRFDPARALALMAGCLEVLAEAHSHRIINRSLEPANLFISHPGSPNERLQILHFGAMFLDDTDIQRMTRTGDLMGAARYLSPEYIEHGTISEQLDVYQAGLVMVEMLTGQAAVAASDPMGCILAHTQGELSIPAWVKDSPLWWVLSKALAVDPKARYADAGRFRRALLALDLGGGAAPELGDEVSDEGRVLAERFEVQTLMAEGGFGKVYQGRHVRTHQPVAIKIMTRRPSTSLHEAFKKRFLVEARAAASINHPNVVSVVGYGMLSDDRPYIVMEKLEGEDLEIEIDTRGPLAPERLIPIFCEALDALGEAHRHQIVHKDLKPANLFLSWPGRPWETIKVLDFGIARMGEGEESKLTQDGRMLFTCHYVAPEYIEHQIAAPQTDVYQMALILVELITGALVVPGEQLECIMAHMHGKFTIPPKLMESPLGAVLTRALSLDHTARYRDGAAFAKALRALDPHKIWRPEPRTQPHEELDDGLQDTVQADRGVLELMRCYRRIQYLHEREPGAIGEMQDLISYCLAQGEWGAASTELAFVEQILLTLDTTLARSPHLGDLERNQRLKAIIWNKRRNTIQG